MFALNRICSVAAMRPACTATITSLKSYASAAKTDRAQTSQKQILVKLRKDTGFPLAKCKQALVKTDYDVKKAIQSLNQDAVKEGWTKLKNLSGRKATQGLVTTYRAENKAILLEINCESDFVAKTQDFQKFVALVARDTLDHFSPTEQEHVILSPQEILKLQLRTKSGTIEDALAKVIGKIKENVKISRGIVASVNTSKNEFLGVYTHPDMDTPNKGGRLPLMGKYAAIVGMRTVALEPQGPLWLVSKARDLAQHVVGMDPASIGSRAKPTERVEQLQTEDKIIEDLDDDHEEFQMEKFSDSDELLHQSFLLDPNITVQNWLDINQLEVKYFLRYQLGGPTEEG